jgi:hypothetical protein
LNSRTNIGFDRWGNEIFESVDINTSWDGIASKNNPMPEEVYLYIVLKCVVKQIEI